MIKLTYNPPATAKSYIQSMKFASFIVGPYGSGKTAASIMKLLYEAARIAPSPHDNIRYSRFAVVRNTRQMLWDTTIPDFLRWFPDGDAGVMHKTESRFTLRIQDIHCEILFRGLDDANDVRRLLSLQLTGGMMDEFREIHKDIYEALAGRIGRYPDKMIVPPRPEWGVDSKGLPIGGCVRDDGTQAKRLWGASNPPDADTFWEELLTDPPDNVHVTIQPSGMSPQADWLQFLDSGYYENLAELHSNDQDWVDIYVHGKFGRSLSGQPVFRSFNADDHVSKFPLKPILNGLRPVLVGMDFGLTPSAVIGQVDLRGRALVFEELSSEGMGVLRFIRTKLKPILVEKFPGAPIAIVGDPAGRQRVQTDERTVYEIIKGEGLKTFPAVTNSIVARVHAVEQFLNRYVDGGPGFLINPHCKQLIAALRSKYRYKIKTSGEPDVVPEKNEASHLADALQYFALHADGQNGGHYLGTQRHDIKSVSAVGWT